MNKGTKMKNWLRAISLMILGGSMSACAMGGTSWKEEVLLHDGGTIMVNRSQTYGGSHEIGQPPPVKEHTIDFTLPSTNKTITWTSEYGEDIGRTNFTLLAVHVLNDQPYIVSTPNLCLSYNKWGRPNPPYVIFKYDSSGWQKIPLSEFPLEFKTFNVVIDTYGHGDVDRAVKSGVILATAVRHLNSDLTQPEYQTILREPYPNVGGSCPELVYYKGAWVGPGNSIGKRMMDRNSK